MNDIKTENKTSKTKVSKYEIIAIKYLMILFIEHFYIFNLKYITIVVTYN